MIFFMKRILLLALILLPAIFVSSANAISAKTISFVAHYEGFSSKVYTDASGYPTIGYGHKLSGYTNDRWSRKYARKVLRDDLAWAEQAVRKYIDVDLDGNQMTALTSFTFNCGTGALKDSDLRRLLNLGYYSRVPYQLKRWVNGSNGRPVAGLVKRRKAEARLFGHDPPAGSYR